MAFLQPRNSIGYGDLRHPLPYLSVSPTEQPVQKYTVRNLIVDLLNADLDAEITIDDNVIFAVDLTADEPRLIARFVQDEPIQQEPIQQEASTQTENDILNGVVNEFLNRRSPFGAAFDAHLEKIRREEAALHDDDKKRSDWDDLIGDTNNVDWDKL